MSLRSQDLHGIEVPWLATMGADGKWHFEKKADFDQWSGLSYGAGEQVMFIPVPLTDEHFHAAAFRYLHGCVIPFIARHGLHEPNYERAWETIAAQFLPLIYVGKGKKRKLTRQSTAMDKMPCPVLCDVIDRIVAWASDPDELNLTIPFADRSWKWKLEQQRRQHAPMHVASSSRRGGRVLDRTSSSISRRHVATDVSQAMCSGSAAPDRLRERNA